MTGSSVAAVSTFGVIALPEMLKRNYRKELAAGSVVAAGSLAHLIPPSIMMIMYALICDVSARDCLLAGVVPGVILAGLYVVIVVVWTYIDESAAPVSPPASLKERALSLRFGVFPVALILAVLGTILAGIATVTESAALGAFTSLAYGIIVRKINWKAFVRASVESSLFCAFIMLVALGGKVFSFTLSYLLIPQYLVNLITDLGASPILTVVIFQIAFIVFGMFIDPLGMLFICMPVMLPALLHFGLSPIWFGVLAMINLEFAYITPPLGINLYIAKSIAGEEVTLMQIMKGSMIFETASVITLALLVFFPQLALWVV
jgi:tripartite ATP-independent transporter DctM subunit